MKKHKILKRLASLTIAAALTISSFSLSASAATVSDFTDVKATAWYYRAVEYATDNGLFAGTSSRTFSPNASMTRSMFVTVLGRMAGIDTSEYLRYRFSDVKPTMYYAPYVEWAATYGIVNGVGNGKFAPDAAITREQMAVILYNFAQKTDNAVDFDPDAISSFPDKAKRSDFARDGLCWALSHGIVNGMGGKLNPKGTATRAQVAQVMMNAEDVLVNKTVTADPVEDEPETPDTDNGTGSGNGLAQYEIKTWIDEEGYYHETKYCTVLTNGKPATAKNVTELISSLRDKYPEGEPSPSCDTVTYSIMRDVFGEDCDGEYIENDSLTLSDFQPGDSLDYKDVNAPHGHSVTVIRKVYFRNNNGEVYFAGLQVAEGNYNGTYHWDRLITDSSDGFEILARNTTFWK